MMKIAGREKGYEYITVMEKQRDRTYGILFFGAGTFFRS